MLEIDTYMYDEIKINMRKKASDNAKKLIS